MQKTAQLSAGPTFRRSEQTSVSLEVTAEQNATQQGEDSSHPQGGAHTCAGGDLTIKQLLDRIQTLLSVMSMPTHDSKLLLIPMPWHCAGDGLAIKQLLDGIHRLLMVMSVPAHDPRP